MNLQDWLTANGNPHVEKRYNGNVTAVCAFYVPASAYRDLWHLSDYFVETVCGPYVCLMPR